MNCRNFFKKTICLLKGYTKCNRNTEAVGHYIKISAGRGAFCRDPERYEYDGRLYRCARCNELFLIHSILQWELIDLVKTTLQNIPQGIFENAFACENYDFARLYR